MIMAEADADTKNEYYDENMPLMLSEASESTTRFPEAGGTYLSRSVSTVFDMVSVDSENKTTTNHLLCQ